MASTQAPHTNPLHFAFVPACPDTMWVFHQSEIPSQEMPSVWHPTSVRPRKTDTPIKWFPVLMPVKTAQPTDTPIRHGDVYKALARLWQYRDKYSVKGSRFQQEVIKTVKEIGLLHPAPPAGKEYPSHAESYTLGAWRRVAHEMALWVFLLECFCNIQAAGGEVDFMDLLETREHARGGLPSPYDRKTEKDFFLALQAEVKGDKNFETVKDKVADYLLGVFQKNAEHGLRTIHPTTNQKGFWACVGSQVWAYFELSQMCRSGDLKLCKNPNCKMGKVFVHNKRQHCCEKCRKACEVARSRAKKRQAI
jgi:hypothetical protein